MNWAVGDGPVGLAGPAAVTSGYRPALAVAAGLSVLGAALGLRRRRERRQATPAAVVTAPPPAEPVR